MHRSEGEKIDVSVYTPQDYFANNPQVIRTDREVVLAYGAQEINKLRATRTHQHHQPFGVLTWSVSTDGGFTWRTTDRAPAIGAVRDCSYGEPLKDGGMVTMSFTRPLVSPYAFVQKGTAGMMPYNNHLPAVGTAPLTDIGPHPHFYFHSMTRTADNALLAGGYALMTETAVHGHYTTVFLRSEDEGRSWRYASRLDPTGKFGFSETGLLGYDDGRVLCVVRTDWDHVPPEQRPPEASVGYGGWLYQAESLDNGRTWSRPVQLPLWGHPPYLLRLASGRVLMVYGHRRPPYTIRAILSHDEGRTWDVKTLRTVRLFDPGDYDIGYPQATQLADGTILCTYYGYSSEQTAGMPDNHGNPISLNPCGIFVSLFDDDWCLAGEDGIQH